MTDGPGTDPDVPPLPPASSRARPRPSDADLASPSPPDQAIWSCRPPVSPAGDFEAFARCAGYRFEKADGTFANPYGLSHRHTPSPREAIHDRAALDSRVRVRLRRGLRRVTQPWEG
ncbi:MAG TPA: hypothetical protein VG184_12250 [Acidimicrobiales bacterium]|nr:hypothetical protein [Acidimicrobiales bacterium]